MAVGAVGFDTPAGLYHIQNKAIDPAWHVPNSDWAGDLAGTVEPGGPREPAQGPLARHLQRRRHPRHRRDLLAGHAASHGCIRMAIPDVIELYDQVPVGAPRSTSPRAPRSASIGTSSQPCSSSEACRRSVCRMQSVPMKMPRSRFRSTEYHIVEASLGPLDRVPGRDGLLVVVREPGLDQLSPRRHPSVLRVDEEDTHSGRG